jgi:hypothetical protein
MQRTLLALVIVSGKMALTVSDFEGVDFDGARFVVHFSGERLFEVEDATFSNPGRLGLWTKADGFTHFDDFETVMP